MSLPKRAAHWAQLGEDTFVLGIWLLYWIHHLFGRIFFRACLFPVVTIYWLLRPTLQASSMQYLQKLETETGALGRVPSRRDSVRHVVLFSETMLDKLLVASGKYNIDAIDKSALSLLDSEANASQGGVIITAHLGCLELCRELAQKNGSIHLNILVHTQHAEQFNKLLTRLNPNHNMRLIEVTDITPATAIVLTERISAGEYVVIAGDRVPVFSDNVVEVEFLGQIAPFPIGPYVLASLLKCPMYLLACIHSGKGYAIHFEKLADRIQLPRGQRLAAIAEYATLYAQALTALLKKSPYDWFNFFPFWDQRNAKN